jgi:thermitase
VGLCVIDTGIDQYHPDVAASFGAGKRALVCKSFVAGESAHDHHGHGTHCMGIVKAVAPGVDLITAKVLGDSGSGSTTGINAGRVWAAQEGADIISESLGDGGGPPISADLAAYDRAYELGVSIANAALGNAGYNGRSTIGRPGSYDKHNHGIAAIQSDWRTIAGFSSGGPQARFATPGAGIVSCRPGNGWVNMSGTSGGVTSSPSGCCFSVGDPIWSSFRSSDCTIEVRILDADNCGFIRYDRRTISFNNENSVNIGSITYTRN